MKREFSNPEYGSFSNEWADFFIDLGEYIVTNLTGNSRVVLLTPTTKIIPFLISLGACRKLIEGEVSTGFKPIEEIWEEIQNTELGTEIHIMFREPIFEIKKGALKEKKDDMFTIQGSQATGSVIDGCFYPDKNNPPNIDISIVKDSKYIIPERSRSEKGDPNLQLLGKFYEGLDPLGVLGLPNNLIQIVGNRRQLTEEAEMEFAADNLKGTMADLLITRNSFSNLRELTYITSDREESLVNEANLSIFVQAKYTNMTNLLNWTNNFPQVFIIPRSANNIVELTDLLNTDYFEREEDIHFKELDIPKGCEIMGYHFNNVG